jgi:hypothetical protein
MGLKTPSGTISILALKDLVDTLDLSSVPSFVGVSHIASVETRVEVPIGNHSQGIQRTNSPNLPLLQWHYARSTELSPRRVVSL